MRFQYDHDYHIHSKLSTCSDDPEQTTERILQYAKDNGLKRVVVTDHLWARTLPCDEPWYVPQDIEHISQSLPLPKAEGIEFLFGCETELNRNLMLGVPKDKFDLFSFIIIPTTHLHIKGFVIAPEDMRKPDRMAELWVERLDAVLNMDLPFHKIGIAHLVCEMIGCKAHGNYLQPIALLKDEDMRRLFTKAAAKGVGIEINQYDFSYPTEDLTDVVRMFKIAKECGCKFYLGSDSHHPDWFMQSKEIFEKAIDLIGLEESDKFYIGK